MQRVLGIAGSLRRGSFNKSLLRTSSEIAPAAMKISLYEDLATIPPLNEDSLPGDAVARLRESVASADGLLFATPEYNWSLPGVLKNAIDWLSLDKVLISKPVAIVGATPGRGATRLAQSALRQVLTATESLVMPAPALFIREAARAFDVNGVLVDDGYRQELASVVAAFSVWIARF